MQFLNVGGLHAVGGSMVNVGNDDGGNVEGGDEGDDEDDDDSDSEEPIPGPQV